MTYLNEDFMPLGRQLFDRTLADALSDLARQKYGTAKQVARSWGIDPATAANLFKGHLSIPTLMKAVAVEGWGLWEAIGAEVTGETYEQFVERKLRQAIREADDARSNLVHLRARREALDALTADSDAPGGGPDAEQLGSPLGVDRRGPDQPRHRRTGTAAD